jgi:hypothetical protein
MAGNYKWNDLTLLSKVSVAASFLVIGAITGPAFGLGYGALVTSTSRNAAVTNARIDVLAAVCSRMARSYQQTAADTTDMTVYTARDLRNTLAARFAVMPSATEADRGVADACADKLQARS